MPDNLVSYNRFTSLPPIISRFGWTEEEAASVRGKPDPNPLHSPMAAPRTSQIQLALTPSGSDSIRLTNPTEPQANPYEGPTPTLVLSRSAAKKIGGNIINELQQLVQGGAVEDPALQALMLDSLRRVAGLREFITHLNQMTEGVYVRSLAASKG